MFDVVIWTYPLAALFYARAAFRKMRVRESDDPYWDDDQVFYVAGALGIGLVWPLHALFRVVVWWMSK